MPLLAESIDELMDGIESSPAKLNSSQCYSSDVQIKNEPKTTIKKEVSYNGENFLKIIVNISWICPSVHKVKLKICFCYLLMLTYI